MRLPVRLTRKLAELFPDADERDEFIVETLSKAIDTQKKADTQQPLAIGGTLHLYTDGGSRGNPGQAAVGCVLIDPNENKVLREYGECIGIQTNNIAEYQALITGLNLAKEFCPNHLVCHLDSELVVKQVNGEYRVKMATFTPLIQQINDLKSQFPHISFVYIPRAKNARADMLVNRALDGMQGKI